MIKVIIAGSRTCTDYQLLKTETDTFLDGVRVDSFISGGATGADQLGERYANQVWGITPIRVLPNWRFGRQAGRSRNMKMAQMATHCICFRDIREGRSNGTNHMIATAKEHGLKLKVVNYGL